MKSKVTFVLFSVLCIFNSLTLPTAAASKMVWVYPSPNSLITESPTPLLGYVDGWGKKSLSAKVAGEGDVDPREHDLTVFKGKVFSGAIELFPGKNIVEVGGDEMVLLFRPGFEGEKEDEFKKPKAHEGLFKSCGPCHAFSKGDLVQTNKLPDMCLRCHDMRSALTGTSARVNKHPASVTPDCNRCHEPHVSFNSSLLKDGADQLCESCHEAQAAREDIHPAYEEGGCLLCHDPHSSEEPGLLNKKCADVCRECHDKASEGAASDYHSPLFEGRSCAACHDPHETADKLIPADTKTLCLKCHPKILDKGHGQDLSECVTCHDPHGKKDVRLIRPNIAETCGECHDGVVEGEVVHPAIEEYGCNGCHNPHVDDNVELAKYSCGKCHNFSRKAELSSIHGRLVIPPYKCVMCHEPHASKRKSLIRAKLHRPLTQRMCTSCHWGGDEGLRVTDVAVKCRKCHSFIDDLYDRGASIHPPVNQGKCVICHQPHMSDEPSLLRISQVETCGKCHDAARPPDGRQRHPAAETCTDCHNPHGGELRKFLAAEPPELCINCHDDPRDAEGEIHPALEDGCLVCHDPHYGFSPGFLKGDVPWLPCFGCHKNPLEGKENIHPAIEEGGCVECHDPHASPNDHFLKKSGNVLCRNCHDPDGHHVLNEKGAADVNVPKSFPRSGDEFACVGCHSPHASNDDALMVRGRDKLCVSCHEAYE